MAKKKQMLEKNSKFFKAYFIVMVVYAALGVFSMFSYRFMGLLRTPGMYIQITLYALTGIIFYAIIILSIIALIMFIVHRFRKGTLVMPIYVLAYAIFFFIFSFVSMFLYMISPMFGTYMLMGIPLVSYVFMLAYSIYMLVKFR